MTGGVWSDLSGVPAEGKAELTLSTIRRNLQRDYLSRLSRMVLGSRGGSTGDQFLYVSFNSGSVPADARALARLHLKEIRDQIARVLDRPELTIDDTTRAHLEECRQGIAKVLDAPLAANEF